MAETAAKTEAIDPSTLLCDGAFTDAELETAVKVMAALGRNEAEYSTAPMYKRFRGALVPLLKHTFSLRLQKKAGEGEKNVMAVERRRIETRRRDLERNLLDTRALRSSRIDKLKSMLGDGSNAQTMLMIPDGPATEGGGWSGGGGDNGSIKRIHGEGSTEGIDAGAASEVAGGLGGGSTLARASDASSPQPLVLEFTEQCCYVCKARFAEVHPFYATLCPACSGLNYAKRRQSADLFGRFAVLTGGRIKVGFQIGLKLLRAGATLIVTTRFPHDAAARYRTEPDHADWGAWDTRHMRARELDVSQDG